MNAARLLRAARAHAGLTQRALAARSGVPQPTIAAIESGAQDPRYRTLDRLIRACGQDLDLITVEGLGIDRTLGQTIKGVYPYALPIGDGAALTDLMAGLSKAQTLSADDFNKNTMSGTEKVSSVYVLANLKLGVVEVQPGLRYEHTDIHDTFWNQVTNPDDSAGASAFASNQTTYDFVLPSVHANYRPDAETVVRASIWRSYVRPAFFQPEMIGAFFNPGIPIRCHRPYSTLPPGSPPPPLDNPINGLLRRPIGKPAIALQSLCPGGPAPRLRPITA